MTRSTASGAHHAARRFRVKQTSDGILLVDRQNPAATIAVRETLIHLTIEMRLNRVCRSLVPGDIERWITVDVTRLTIGSESDSSPLSVWPEDDSDRYIADNAIFAIAGESLEHQEITYSRIVDRDATDRLGYRYVDEPSHSPNNGAGQEETDESGALAVLWHHASEDRYSGERWAALVLTIGFHEPHFSELVKACESGLADTLILECRAYAMTTGALLESPRDLIVSAGDTVRLDIDEAVVSVPVGRRYQDASRGSVKELGSDESADSWNAERAVDAVGPSRLAGPAFLFATTALALSCGIAGFSGLAVLGIVIVGCTSALIATLSSSTAHVVGSLEVLLRALRQRKAP